MKAEPKKKEVHSPAKKPSPMVARKRSPVEKKSSSDDEGPEDAGENKLAAINEMLKNK